MDKLTKAEGSLILDMIYDRKKDNISKLENPDLVLSERIHIENEIKLLDSIYNKDYFCFYL